MQTVCRFFFDLLSFFAYKEPIHRGKAGWGIAGLLLDNNYRQLDNNFLFFGSLYFASGSWGGVSEYYSNDLLRCMGGMDDGECGSQPLQKTKGMPIGNQRKKKKKGCADGRSGKVLTSGGDGIMVSIYVCCPRFPTRSSAGWLFG